MLCEYGTNLANFDAVWSNLENISSEVNLPPLYILYCNFPTLDVMVKSTVLSKTNSEIYVKEVAS